jgi:hypothetical protein
VWTVIDEKSVIVNWSFQLNSLEEVGSARAGKNRKPWDRDICLSAPDPHRCFPFLECRACKSWRVQEVPYAQKYENYGAVLIRLTVEI